jgi:hypothetical protein
MVRPALLTAAALFATLAAPATAGPPTPESRKAIEDLLDLLAMHQQIGETHYGELASGKSLTLVFPADATVEYYLHAIADDDAENIDLIAYEADGTEIDIDDAADNAPVLNIQAAVHRSPIDKPKGIARPITVEVRMTTCNAATCSFGLRIDQVE